MKFNFSVLNNLIQLGSKKTLIAESNPILIQNTYGSLEDSKTTAIHLSHLQKLDSRVPCSNTNLNQLWFVKVQGKR